MFGRGGLQSLTIQTLAEQSDNRFRVTGTG